MSDWRDVVVVVACEWTRGLLSLSGGVSCGGLQMVVVVEA